MKKLLYTFIMSMPLVFCGCNGKFLNNNTGLQNEIEAGYSNVTTTPQPLEFTEAEPEPLCTICLDAGHGFSDPGCLSPFYEDYEADITLEVTKLLKAKLEEAGAKVIMTHDGITFPAAQAVKDYADKYQIEYLETDIKANNVFSAYERAVYCQALDAEENLDLFLSLHINAIEGHPEISRYDIYYNMESPHAGELDVFCVSLKTKLDKFMMIHRESQENSMLVNKYAQFPALLVEMGYASNEGDAADLKSEEWRENYTDILVQEIMNFTVKN